MLPNKPTDKERLFVLLSKNYAICKKLAEQALKGQGITLAEFTLLRIVENTPKITAGEARERLFATAPSIAEVVKSLETKNFLKRTKDKKDTRRLLLKLTTRGSSIVEICRKRINTALERLDLSTKTVHALEKELSSLLSSLTSHGR